MKKDKEVRYIPINTQPPFEELRRILELESAVCSEEALHQLHFELLTIADLLLDMFLERKRQQGKPIRF